MKTHTNRRFDRTYLEAVTTARRLQADLINLIDETLLATWDDAGAVSDRALEIMNYLHEEKSNDGVECPAVINLNDVLNRVLMLAEYSYRLRTDVKPVVRVVDEG